MEKINELLAQLPEESKDLRLNLKRVLDGESLNPEQTWGVALASAYFLRDARLIEAVQTDATAHLSPAAAEDARASASIMGMNTVYYRFRHLMDSDNYSKRPANLRMMRMAKPATDTATFELFSMACAALAGCGMCLKAHEANLLKHGLSEDNVHDSVRIAAIMNGVSVALAASNEAVPA